MKNLFLPALCMLISTAVWAQSPDRINYQAVARNGQGSILSNQNISVRFTVHESTPVGTIAYSETHAISTNTYGLFTCELGGGTPVTGTFTTVAWGNDIHFLEVEVDPAGGSSYTSLSTTQLISVPYSLYANEAGHALTSDYATQADHANTADTAGFANDAQNAVNAQNAINAQNAQNAINAQNAVNAQQADVADSLSGFSPSQLPTIYKWLIHDTDSNTFVTTELSPNNNLIHFNLNGSNRYVFYPRRIQTNFEGTNLIIGFEAGRSINPTLPNALGDQNTILGYSAGYHGVNINRNTYIGYASGYNDTSGFANVFVGNNTGYQFRSGGSNVFVGSSTGQNMVTGSSNVFIGTSTTGYRMENGSNNILMGAAAGYNATSTGNLILGYNAGRKVSANGYNVLLGYSAELADSNFTNATALGYSATVQASNAMRFGNNSVTKWGFGADAATNRALQVGSNSSNGNGAYLSTGGAWTNTSNRNLKEDIQRVDSREILTKIMQLEISKWKYTGTEEYHIGPMAQDFYTLFQVGNDNESISTIDPAGVSLAAIQELMKYVQVLEKRIEELENK